ncbi:polysaccharide biosynthesis protein [Pseudomonas matsuisoli]|uniref:Polysaccharide biosynthesis protein n=2 Tax=Pseudomonas matsuisoli TaxID=1515666 RepID=A0A917V0Q9_9PSED|nr:polysaccharide biosynthesis protein [Pseudomonas matsuisoli]
MLADASRNRLLRNILTVVTGTAGAQAVTMALMPVITRLYGPEAYGVLGVFLSLVMMTVPVAALTYPMAIVLPRRDVDAHSLIRLSLLTGALFAGISALLLAVWGTQLANMLDMQPVEPYLMLLPFTMFSAAALEIIQQWLYRKQRFRLTASTGILHSLVFNGGRCLAGLIHPTVVVLLCTTAFSQALQALMLLVGFKRTAHKQAPASVPAEHADTEPPATMREMALRHSDFPLFRFPQLLINTLSQNLPTLVLAAHFGVAAAGFFALCKQTLSMPTNLIGKSVADVYYPRLSKAAHNKEPIAGLLMKATCALGLVGLVPFGLVFAAGPWLFAFVFGSEWHVAGEFARWLALGEYMILVSRPCTVAVPVLNLQGRFLIFEIVSTALRIGSLAVGVLLLDEALSTVMSFVGATILIYTAMILIVLFEARRATHHTTA